MSHGQKRSSRNDDSFQGRFPSRRGLHCRRGSRYRLLLLLVGSNILTILLHISTPRKLNYLGDFISRPIEDPSHESSSNLWLMNDSVPWPATGDPELANGTSQQLINGYDLMKQMLNPDCKVDSSDKAKQKLAQVMSYSGLQQRLANCEEYFRMVPVEAMRMREHEDKIAEGGKYSFGFSHLVHEEVVILEIFLALMFRPQNVHCIHVDRKAAASVHRSVRSIVRCYQERFGADSMFIVRRPIEVYLGHISTLQADLLCMQELLMRSGKWTHFISTAGTELPIGPYANMYEMLEQANGGNIVGGVKHYNRDRITHYFELARVGPGLHDFQISRTEFKRKPIPPYNLTLYKSYRSVILTRSFALFLINHPIAIGFYNWLEDTYLPEEAFFATLAQIKEIRHPGNIVVQDFHMITMNESCPVRYSLWEYASEQHACHGQFQRSICVLAVGDLAFVRTKGALLANKFRTTVDPAAPLCQWKYLRDLNDEALKISNNVKYKSLS